jgi:hypothetical protein
MVVVSANAARPGQARQGLARRGLARQGKGTSDQQLKGIDDGGKQLA